MKTTIKTITINHYCLPTKNVPFWIVHSPSDVATSLWIGPTFEHHASAVPGPEHRFKPGSQPYIV